jgi:hypothetical protein
MASKGKAALTGAASGAAAGAALGPWGAAAGGVIGGALGYFGAGDDEKAPTYNPTKSNFDYGLGPSSSYASQQSAKYDVRQKELQALGNDAYNRDAPTMDAPTRVDHVASDGQSFLQGADADGRRRQVEALGGLQGQVGALNKFAQTPQGPSAAQAQLQAGADMASRQQLGMARTQQGGGGAALRNAAFNTAGIQGAAANNSAILSAQESQAHRAQQLQALGAAQQGAGQVAGYTGQLRGADQGFAQVQAGQANYDAGAVNQFNQQQQQMQFGVGQANLGAAVTSRGQNDAASLGFHGQSNQYEALRNQLASGQQAAGTNYEGAVLQGKGLGSSNHNAAQQQSNAETGMMLGAMSGAAGAYAQMNGGGNPTSDIRAKEDIKPVSVLDRYTADRGEAARQNVREQVQSAQASRMGADSDLGEFGGLRSRVGLGAAGDARQARMHELLALGANDRYGAAQEGQKPSTWGTGNIIPDMRPAQGYEYAYKDPERHGEGRYVGPMAQDLEHLPGVVEKGPDGLESINAPRLTLANTAALSEQQRRDEEDRKRLERLEQMTALGGIPQSGTFSGYR